MMGIPPQAFAMTFLALWLAGCDGGTCRAPVEDSEVPLLRVGAHEIAPVLLNDAPAGLVLDTGAFGTSVTPQAVRDLKLETHTLPVETTGVGGGGFNQATEIDHLKLGGAEISGAAALVVPLSRKGLDQFPAYGLLGEDLLTNWDVDLDATHDRLTLYEPQQCGSPSPPWTGVASSIDIPKILTGPATQSADIVKGLQTSAGLQSAHNGEILFPVSLDGRTMTALLDTGASFSMVRQSASGLDDLALGSDPVGHATGINLLRVDTRRHAFKNLRIGETDYGPLVIDIEKYDLPGADILLGQDFLRRHRVYVAFHAGKLLIAKSDQ